jgi:hypothetical protein
MLRLVADGPEFLEAMSSDGRRVFEADLGDAEVADWIGRAHAVGAELLWLHANVDLSSHGFERFPGYVRMRTEAQPRGEPLPRLKPELYAATLDGSYRGLWGHKRVSEDAEPSVEAVILALHDQRGSPVGLCTVYPTDRLVDGPGVLPHARATAAYTRLLLGACDLLSPGPVDLDSWGDCAKVIDAYEEVGFEIVERTAGWQLLLE